MHLRKYLFVNSMTHEEFSQKVDVSRTQITKIINNKVKPSVNLVKKIKEATNGEVTYEDLIDEE